MDLAADSEAHGAEHSCCDSNYVNQTTCTLRTSPTAPFSTRFPRGNIKADVNNFSAEIKDALSDISIFGIAKNSEHLSTERNYVGVFRLSWLGSRSVVLFPLMHAAKLMRDLEVHGELSPNRIFDFCKKMSAANLDKLHAMGSLFSCTVSVGDILYVPAGWVVAERVAANMDFVGVRVASLTTVDIKALTDIDTHLRQNNVPSEMLSSIIAAMTPKAAASSPSEAPAGASEVTAPTTTPS